MHNFFVWTSLRWLFFFLPQRELRPWAWCCLYKDALFPAVKSCGNSPRGTKGMSFSLESMNWLHWPAWVVFTLVYLLPIQLYMLARLMASSSYMQDDLFHYKSWYTQAPWLISAWLTDYWIYWLICNVVWTINYNFFFFWQGEEMELPVVYN